MVDIVGRAHMVVADTHAGNRAHVGMLLRVRM